MTPLVSKNSRSFGGRGTEVQKLDVTVCPMTKCCFHGKSQQDMRVSFRKAVKLAAFLSAFIIFNALIGFELFSGDCAPEKVLGRRRHDNGDRQDTSAGNASSADTLTQDPSRDQLQAPANFGQNAGVDNDERYTLLRSLSAGTGEKLSTKLAVGQLSHGHARRTELSDVFISVKTTGKFHASRLQLVVQTWFLLARDQTYFFTDSDDKEMNQLTGGHLINTNCSSSHNRQSLCCKMSAEYDAYLASKKRWMCHFDDDIYVNIPVLTELLQKYKHTDDWYLGKPSLRHPIEVNDFENPGAKITFWFATGSAFCISRALALKMLPHAGGGRLMTLGEKLRLPDDCVMGYIIGARHWLIIHNKTPRSFLNRNDHQSTKKPCAEKTAYCDRGVSFSPGGSMAHQAIPAEQTDYCQLLKVWRQSQCCRCDRFLYGRRPFKNKIHPLLPVPNIQRMPEDRNLKLTLWTRWIPPCIISLVFSFIILFSYSERFNNIFSLPTVFLLDPNKYFKMKLPVIPLTVLILKSLFFLCQSDRLNDACKEYHFRSCVHMCDWLLCRAN